MPRTHFQSNIIKFCTVLFLFLYPESCKKDNWQYIPYVKVNLTLDLTSELADLGGGDFITVKSDTVNPDYSIVDYHNKKFPNFEIYQKINGNGLVVYCAQKGFEYYAFDLTCPYKAFQNHCTLNKDGLILICPCCKSKFLFSGNNFIPANGDSTNLPLMQYQAYIAGSYGQYLYISN